MKAKKRRKEDNRTEHADRLDAEPKKSKDKKSKKAKQEETLDTAAGEPLSTARSISATPHARTCILAKTKKPVSN